MGDDQGTRTAIRTKLTTMAGYLQELRGYLVPDAETHASSRASQRLVERMAQVVIECAIDANQLLLTLNGRPPAESARESFSLLLELAVLNDHLCRRFQQTYVGLRNRIVHDYERLDARIVFHAVAQLLEDGRAYIGAVTTYLDQDEGPSPVGEGNEGTDLGQQVPVSSPTPSES